MSQRKPRSSGAASEPSTAFEDKTYHPTLRSIPGARPVALLLVPAGVSGLIGAMVPGAWPLVLLTSLLGLVIVGAVAIGLLFFAMRAADRVRLSPRGIECKTRAGVASMAWEEVDWVQVYGVSLWGLIPITTCHIGNRDGRALQFGNMFDGFPEMVARVGLETTPRLLAWASERIVAGHDVWFGRIVVSEDGIKHNRKLLPWHALGAHHVADGVLHVNSRDPASPSLMIRLADVENLDVLVQVMAWATDEGSGSGS